MTTPLTPEGAKSWFNTFYSVTEKSTPITMLFLVAFLVVGYVVTKREIKRLQDMNATVWQQLQQRNNDMIQLALDCHKRNNQ